MKLTTLNGFMLIAGLSAIGLASVLLEPMPSKLYAGDTHILSWTTDRDYVSSDCGINRFGSVSANNDTAGYGAFPRSTPSHARPEPMGASP